MPDPVQKRPDGLLVDTLTKVSEDAVPGLSACLELAKLYEGRGEQAKAIQWVFAATDAANDYSGWLSAARVLRRCQRVSHVPGRRVRVAVLGSYTTAQLASLLPLAAARVGLELVVYESDFGQYRFELLNPESNLYSFNPEVVVLAVHEGEVMLPTHSPTPEAAVQDELGRWTSLWDAIGARLGAVVVHHTFAVPPDVALGHLALKSPGSRYSMLHVLNQRLAESAGHRVGLVDCERLSGVVGKYMWFDARYYHLAKQAVGLNAVPMLARHTAAVIAAQLGLAKKCLVLDLDNTLWGGVLGEVGPHGIQIGGGPAGEAYSAFQRYVLELRGKGVIIAVCSKNDDRAVREVLDNHPDMLIRTNDIAVIAASWDDKPSSIRSIASTLGIGLDSLVFVDDNPAEREAVRQLVPEVDVVALPAEPADYVRALSSYPFFETAALTADDALRTEQYQARAQVKSLESAAGSIEEFLSSLDMKADIRSLDDSNAARVAQLVNKTNQFNVTNRRRTQHDIEVLIGDPKYVSQVVRLRDRFADHGIVGVLLAERRGDELHVDTWLLSCRVIGRTVEDEMMRELIAAAEVLGCTRILGTYAPSAKNRQVADLFARFGFTPSEPGSSSWRLDIPASVLSPGFIEREFPVPLEEVI